ncbi:SpoIIE family protein phosphatase [Streptomyces sp. NBC_01214]|uniref:SpoIIE family protein phosphatase n=1 Tax=Streptomyces sp. NBC_01214 TaxID=2903777 RepID=UPI002255E4BD|nr:SpoIIE family protein phosphatase [Streptomyces sp. NBC_01214]MCX4807664.1 SpoIIE family protein phosphatase [Streptomyces sp. NBC_01214]
MDRFARLVSRLLHVPVAFVSLVEEERQILPGLFGLPEPWAGSRALPLSHSLCRYVVASGQPLVVPDARADDRLRSSPAIGDLGLIAYAGMPLTDADGLVLGSLCAIDHEPRTWGDGELADLEDLAAACSAELCLRILSAQSRSAQKVLETARAAAERARSDAERLEQEAQSGMDHAELLLRASEELAQTSGLEDVRRRLRDLFVGVGKPSYVGLLVADKDELHRIADPDVEHSVEREVLTLPASAAFPSTRAMRERRAVFVPDREALVAGYSPEAVGFFDRMGFTTVLCLPLWGSRALLGVLAVCWAKRHEVGVTERATLTAASGYIAQAVERALHLDERISVARQLQEAMLTDLPDADHIEISALYEPAAVGDMIGGDWYDAYHLPPASPGGEPAALMVTVGDITGHDMHAATIMGQIRSMLRQATLDHPPYSPATALTALDAACSVLPIEAGGTLVHARLDLADGGPDWTLTWSNAGHPPPLLRTPDGRVTLLEEHDILLHRDLGPFHRTEARRGLPAGSTLLFYTDGLIERRGHDIDASLAQLVALLARHGDSPLPELLHLISHRPADPAPGDDVVVLALRVP